MTMIERVAAAMKECLASGDEVYFRDDGDTCMVDGHVNMTTLARAALDALGSLAILADVHTRDDDQAGFTVQVGARPEFYHDASQYIEAWKDLREIVHRQTDPKETHG